MKNPKERRSNESSLRQNDLFLFFLYEMKPISQDTQKCKLKLKKNEEKEKRAAVVLTSIFPAAFSFNSIKLFFWSGRFDKGEFIDSVQFLARVWY